MEPINLKTQNFILSQSRSEKMTQMLQKYFKIERSNDIIENSSEQKSISSSEKIESCFEEGLAEADAIKGESKFGDCCFQIKQKLCLIKFIYLKKMKFIVFLPLLA